MGVFPALREALDDSEDELSARASGAVGGGLALAVLGGLNGRTWVDKFTVKTGEEKQNPAINDFTHGVSLHAQSH